MLTPNASSLAYKGPQPCAVPTASAAKYSCTRAAYGWGDISRRLEYTTSTRGPRTHLRMYGTTRSDRPHALSCAACGMFSLRDTSLHHQNRSRAADDLSRCRAAAQNALTALTSACTHARSAGSLRWRDPCPLWQLRRVCTTVHM